MTRSEQALSLLIEQYKNSPRIRALVEAFAQELDFLQIVFDDLYTKRTLETATGVNLDVIGKIVVLDRPFSDAEDDDIFTFDNPGDIGAGFSELGRPDIGGFWVGLDPFEGALVDDETYRKFIKAKIIRNTGDATLDDIQQYLSFVFGAQATVLTTGIGFVDVVIGRPISRREELVLRSSIPLAAGIRLGDIFYTPTENGFSFFGNPQCTGFGGVGEPQVGGGFAGIL